MTDSKTKSGKVEKINDKIILKVKVLHILKLLCKNVVTNFYSCIKKNDLFTEIIRKGSSTH